MGVIIDQREVWFCRDCGEAVSDDETLARLDKALRPPFHVESETLLDDNGGTSLALTLEGACAFCGGGRLHLRLGKIGIITR